LRAKIVVIIIIVIIIIILVAIIITVGHSKIKGVFVKNLLINATERFN